MPKEERKALSLAQATEINIFMEYLSRTLIPDLQESGMNATADDFTTCVRLIALLMDMVPQTRQPAPPAPKQLQTHWRILFKAVDGWIKEEEHYVGTKEAVADYAEKRGKSIRCDDYSITEKNP